MKFEVDIRNDITYTVRHMPNGDLVEIKTPLRSKPVRGFIRKMIVNEPGLRKSA